MIDLVPDHQKTLHLVQQISVAGRQGVTAPMFLQDVGAAVAEAFEFDSVSAVRYDTEAEEDREIGLAAAAPADHADVQQFTSASLLAGARETQNLVLLAAGDVTTEFALPLMSEGRCLAVLYGIRRAAVGPPKTDWDALASVGVLAATLLEDVLARDEMNERDMLKSEFVALAAHELRNPLSSIYGLSVTLVERGDELAESQRLTLRNALQEQTSRMRNLVEQLLDLSRLDLGAIHISPVPLRLRPRIEELVRPLADTRPDSVTIVVAPDLEAAVDPAALDRMVSNLIANSLRHGEPPVMVTAQGQDRHLRLAVEDRGQGVPPEFVPRLFDRFARSADSRGRDDGSGLGLAIAQAYARAHGGEIVYEPVVPHGARFEVVIPLRGYRDEQRRIEPSSFGAPKPARSSGSPSS
ncbi:MAG TPA: HAMP domain-containing sensor histidine kinase [Gaiellaceae bacterium]|jgi:signal transduction histidine kinase|nr:HAMP domain-containing sensor histidine kinase [Gaiellaceae bacterium]